jgi:MoxR-like ATPase
MDPKRQVPEEARTIIRNIISECQKIVVGKADLIEDLVVALLSEGHVLLEGVPGVAKTTIGKTFAAALGLTFSRIQGSPDILPADIVGTHIFDQKAGSFKLRRGPVFSNILLIDEINRNTSKTNSAVIEAMQERQATIEGETIDLPCPFMVIATQTPIEFQGVFPLPEVLVDRFLMRLGVGYPTASEEIRLTDRAYSLDSRKVKWVASAEQISYLTELAKNVYIAPEVQSYIVDLTRRTREMKAISLGASPRASIALTKTSRSRALINERQYVVPDDVKYLAPRVLEHRLVPSALARSQQLRVESMIDSLLQETPIPQKPA